MRDDVAFAALEFAFDRNALTPGATAIVFDAEVAPVLSRWPAPVCIQPWRPAYDGLVAAGITARPAPDDDDSSFAVALVRLGRNRTVNRAFIANAARHLADDGTLIVVGENRFGPANYGRELGVGNAIVKHKARVFWLTATQARSIPSLDDWSSAIDLRTFAGHPYRTAPGLFGWDRIDPGSELLVRHLPDEVRGRVADLGTGWGYLAIEVLRGGAGVTELDLYEADWRALEAARVNVVAGQDGVVAMQDDRVVAGQANAIALQDDVVGSHVPPRPTGSPAIGFHWHDVTRGLPCGGYDWVVTNPPFHDPRDADPELGRRFIRVAADALVDGGRLLLVANRSLPYELVLAERFRRVTKIVESEGYKVLCATRGRVHQTREGNS
jgi:16S rRNA (guanine1207-N2)-methyltransferase